jgi:hypothetical protein
MVRARRHRSCYRFFRRMIPLVMTSGLILLPVSLHASNDGNPSCRKDPRVVASCITVHGRLSNWNGNPTRRIWIVGTKRMLGVRDGTGLPAPLGEALGDFDHEVYGNFEFCPFTAPKSGVMQVGCIAGVSSYKIEKHTR